MALVRKKATVEFSLLQEMNSKRIRMQGSRNAAVAFAKDVKESLLSQQDWVGFLPISSAQLCLAFMIACCMAASSTEARGISLKDVEAKGAGENLKFDNLKACLLLVSDTGRIAFLEAQIKIDAISNTLKLISGHFTRIGSYLGRLSAPDARLSLIREVENVIACSDRCLNFATDIEGKFNHLVELVCELHRAVLAKDESTSQYDQSCIMMPADKVEMTNAPNAFALSTAKMMFDSVSSSRQFFYIAAREIPAGSPIEQIGLEFAASLAQTVTTTVSQGFSRLVSLDDTRGCYTGNDHLEDGSEGRDRTLKLPNIKDVDDPAYRIASVVKVPVNLLAALLGVGTQSGTTWGTLPKVEEGENPAEGLSFIEGIIFHAVNSTQWGVGEASKTLKDALQNVTEVVSALKTEFGMEHDLRSGKVRAETDVIKNWQTVVGKAQTTTLRLVAVAASFAGAAPGSAPIIGKTPALSTNAINSQSISSVQAALVNAQQTLRITEVAYTTAERNYKKTIENHTLVQIDIARTKAELKSLQTSKFSIKQVQGILKQYVSTLIQMKNQITNLVRFFAALSTMFENVVMGTVSDMLTYATETMKTSIGNISLLDLTLQGLFTVVLMFQAYVSFFSTIIDTYKKTFVEHIIPGLNLYDKICKSSYDPDSLRRNISEFGNFTEEAQKAVELELKQIEQMVSGKLMKRVAAVHEVTKLLPALSTSEAEAIPLTD